MRFPWGSMPQISNRPSHPVMSQVEFLLPTLADSNWDTTVCLAKGQVSASTGKRRVAAVQQLNKARAMFQRLYQPVGIRQHSRSTSVDLIGRSIMCCLHSKRSAFCLCRQTSTKQKDTPSEAVDPVPKSRRATFADGTRVTSRKKVAKRECMVSSSRSRI